MALVRLFQEWQAARESAARPRTDSRRGKGIAQPPSALVGESNGPKSHRRRFLVAPATDCRRYGIPHSSGGQAKAIGFYSNRGGVYILPVEDARPRVHRPEDGELTANWMTQEAKLRGGKYQWDAPAVFQGTSTRPFVCLGEDGSRAHR